MTVEVGIQTKAPKFDFTGLDLNGIDPDRLDFGTRTQDCALIASTYERAAHSTPSESAVFATLSRTVQNNKKFAEYAAINVGSYLQAPSQSVSQAQQQAQKFASSLPESQGVSAQTDHGKQSLDMGTQQATTLGGNDFGSALVDWAKDCIPCGFRIQAFLELHPHVDLLGALEGFVKSSLKLVSDITDLLSNFDAFGSLCELLDLLSFMCVPDLQRIIATLMALFMLEVPTLDGLIGMLQAIIAPLFAPILMAITSLLDQFSLLVTNPLQCIIDSINQQMEKLGVKAPELKLDTSSVEEGKKTIENATKDLSNAMQQLSAQLQEATFKIKEKLNFYIDQVKAMLGEFGVGDSAYIQAKLKILKIIRMVSFVTAIIIAISQGHAACNPEREPELNDIDNFFNTYLNPNSAYSIRVDNGELVVTEKDPNFDNAIGSLSETENVIKFEGEDLLLPELKKVADNLVNPIRVALPCKMQLQISQVDQTNQWIKELSK